MRKTLLLAAALLVAILPAEARKAKKFTHNTVQIPQVSRQVIAVETDNTALVFLVRENGQLMMLHYGARVGDPAQYLAAALSDADYNTLAGMAYPASGGRYIGEPALHVKYADGTHNTELYYTGHQVTAREGCTTTSIGLQDYVTGMEVKLVYDAYGKENVIAAHTEIRNGGGQPVALLNYASAALYIDADEYLLTHFHGAWAAEMQLECRPPRATTPRSC